jgi:hypothetical protein
MGRRPKLTDAELVTLAVAQALLGFTSEARWLRFLPVRMPGAFRGLRLHLICPPPARRTAGLLIVADKDYVSRELDNYLAERRVLLIRLSSHNRTPHPGEPLLTSIRQLVESVNDTLKGQLNLEQHGGRTIEGVGARVAQRLLALTAAIWHNRATGQPITRSPTAFDH